MRIRKRVVLKRGIRWRAPAFVVNSIDRGYLSSEKTIEI